MENRNFKIILIGKSSRNGIVSIQVAMLVYQSQRPSWVLIMQFLEAPLCSKQQQVKP